VGVDPPPWKADASHEEASSARHGEAWKEYLTRLMQEEGLIEEGNDPPATKS